MRRWPESCRDLSAATAKSLVRNLARLARQRHAKYANTIHHLEPNVKESPGGLRDYQIVRWLGQLRQQDPERPLEDAFLYFTQVRCFLHALAGRDANVLSFDAQDAIAEQWYEGDAALAMREYYRHARDRLPRGGAGAGRQRGAAQFSVFAVSRLARTPGKRRLQRPPRARPFSRPAAA